MPRNLRDNNNIHAPAFSVTNHTQDLAMDCNAAADAEIADVLGEVIRQLIDQGILNGSVST